MPKQFNLIYALKDGQITSIADVESGLRCGCTCPACGEPLVAKKGSKVMHHFAHHTRHNCEYGYESSLHLAAKDILSKARKMVIPSVQLQFPGSYKTELISQETEIPIHHVELEQWFGDIIPDIVVYSGKRYFFVEIFVTHPVDDGKLSKLKKANISTIEIDLSKLDRMISPEELKDILLQGNESKKWIYNAAKTKWLRRFREIADRKKIVERGFTQYVYDCPIQIRTWRGYSYANVSNNCILCPYCISCSDRYIRCSGKQQIAHIKDFDIPEALRLKRWEKLLRAKQTETKEPRYCPFCGAAMVFGDAADTQTAPELCQSMTKLDNFLYHHRMACAKRTE